MTYLNIYLVHKLSLKSHQDMNTVQDYCKSIAHTYTHIHINIYIILWFVTDPKGNDFCYRYICSFWVNITQDIFLSTRLLTTCSSMTTTTTTTITATTTTTTTTTTTSMHPLTPLPMPEHVKPLLPTGQVGALRLDTDTHLRCDIHSLPSPHFVPNATSPGPSSSEVTRTVKDLEGERNIRWLPHSQRCWWRN